MVELINFIREIAKDYGDFTVLILIIAAISGYVFYWLYKNFPKTVKNVYKDHIEENKKEHTIATNYRKQITPKVRSLLSTLAEETKADRALLIEFSNGTSNLVGLPFLYLSATIEVVRPGVSLVSQCYQRTNVSLLADFIEHLEKVNYFYVENIEELKETYPIVYGFMAPNGVKSALFYSIYDDQDAIGFVVVTTVKDTFARKDVLPKAASVAQAMSVLLNFDKMKEELQ